MGAIQPWHVILVLIIVLIVFGPGKLPDLGKSLGDSIREFRKATTETHDVPPAPQPPSPTPVTPPAGTNAPIPPGPAVSADEPPPVGPPQP